MGKVFVLALSFLISLTSTAQEPSSNQKSEPKLVPVTLIPQPVKEELSDPFAPEVKEPAAVEKHATPAAPVKGIRPLAKIASAQEKYVERVDNLISLASDILAGVKQGKMKLFGGEVFPNYEAFVQRKLVELKQLRTYLGGWEEYDLDRLGSDLDLLYLTMFYVRSQGEEAAKQEPAISDPQEAIEKARLSAIEKMEKRMDQIREHFMLVKINGKWVNRLSGKILKEGSASEANLSTLDFFLSPVELPKAAIAFFKLDPKDPSSKGKAAAMLKAIEFMPLTDTNEDASGFRAHRGMHTVMEIMELESGMNGPPPGVKP